MSLEQTAIPLERPADPVPIERMLLKCRYKQQPALGLCWAACIAIILGKGKSVREVASEVLKNPNCLQSSLPMECRWGLDPDEVSIAWDRVQIETEDKSLSPVEVRQAIESRCHPVEVMYGRNHLILIVGWMRLDTREVAFIVHDPYNGRKNFPLPWRQIVSGDQRQGAQRSWEILRQLEKA